MAWYDDKQGTVMVRTYKNDGDYRREAARAATHGWLPQATTQAESKVRMGRTLGKGCLTGGLGLLFTGRSKKKGQLTVTYTRSR